MDDFYAKKAQLILDALPHEEGTQRIRRGTMTEIVVRSGGTITSTYLGQLAAGKIKSPPVDKLDALAQALGFPLEWWRLPVEAGPPSISLERDREGVDLRAVMGRIAEIAPEREDMLVQRLSSLLDEIEQEGK